MIEANIRKMLPPGLSLGRTLYCSDCVSSTNDVLKELALRGEEHGTVVLADHQTGGRGRSGRRFESPVGAGVYLSVLLRLSCRPAEAAGLTPWAAVAVCNALETVCGVRADIKWTNDILLSGHKLCGILTELVMDGNTPCVILGIGLNVSQNREDFAGLGLEKIATSLAAEGMRAERETLAAALITALDDMMNEFPQAQSKWLARYRERCVTLNRPVTVLRAGESYSAYALTVEDDFTLRVRWEDGTEECLSAGEVSVRGLMGYQ